MTFPSPEADASDPGVREALQAWCNSYIAAFNAFDASMIGQHWAFPALITQTGKSVVFADRGLFDGNTEKLLSFYRQQGVSKAERVVTDYVVMNADTVAMTVSDVLTDVAGDAIVSWNAAYLLQRRDEGWRAIMAAADGEIEAWAARGSPLGSS